jgi:hypothetical protein
MHRRHAIRWCRWLCSVDVPTEHIAVLLDLDPSEVDSHLAPRTGRGRRPGVPSIPIHYSVKGALSRRPILAETANKVRRLANLGYAPERIAPILVLDWRRVVSFLKRATPATHRLGLVRPRSPAEQRRLDANQRRRARAAKAAAERAVWAQRNAQRDDAGCPVVSYDAPPPPAVDQAAELVPAPEVLVPVSNRWDGPASPFVGAKPKLTAAQATEVCRKRAAGWPMWELAHEYEVSRGEISATVRGRTEVKANEPSESPSCPVPPPAVEPKPLAQHRRGWRPAADEPKWGARGSGALHDDE